MKQNKQDYVILILISFIITNIVAYLDEGIRTFDYLTRLGDWIALIIYTFIFLIIPLLLYLIFNKNKYKLYVATLGFLAPIIVFILPNI